MLLGRVTGTVVATRKEPLAEGWKLLVVRQLDAEDKETGGYVVAADAVGAGVGEVVLYASGSTRSTLLCGRAMTWLLTTSPTFSALRIPASTAALTAATSPRTTAVT